MTHRRAVALMVLVTLLWSIAGVVPRHLDAAPSFEVTFWRSGFNALSLAVERGDKAMVQLLLANGAEARTRPGSGLSALEKAQQQQKPELVALLEKAAK